MRTTLTIMSVVAAAFTASSAAQVAFCNPAKDSVRTAQGGTVCTLHPETLRNALRTVCAMAGSGAVRNVADNVSPQ
jgi:hypothetical protein